MKDKSLYYIEYGCTCEDVSLVILAESLEEATTYAYESAIDSYHSFEGLHGMLDYIEFCEEEGYDPEDKDAEDAFNEMVENDIHYFASFYDGENEDHRVAYDEGVFEI